MGQRTSTTCPVNLAENLATEQECRSCHNLLPLSAFSPNKAKPLGVRTTCKPCACEQAARWKDANPDKVLDARLRRDFGITLDDYEALLAEQCGVCAICGEPPAVAFGRPDGRPGRQGRQRVPRLVVDHDHATGKIRGLLCVHCNRGIGFLKDDPAIVRLALKYLGGMSTS